jgi:hypothetical protein
MIAVRVSEVVIEVSFLGFLALPPAWKGPFSCHQQTTGGEIWKIECFYATYEDYL